MTERASNPSEQSTIPAEADVVIIGAGIVGCSTAYHLSHVGDSDVVVVDQGPLFETGGSTSHAPGLIGQAEHSELMSRLAQYTVELFTGLDADDTPCFAQTGSIDVAHSDARWKYFQRYAEYSDSIGLDEAALLAPGDIRDRFPLLNTDGVHGGYFVPTDGYTQSVNAAEALGREAEVSGVRFHAHTTVTDIETTSGQVAAVATDTGRIETQQVLIATNIWAPLLGDKLDVEIPLAPVEHQYAVSDSLDDLTDRRGEHQLPVIRARDRLIYARQHGDAIGIGSYHDEPTLIPPEEIADHNEVPTAPALREFSEHEFRPATEAMRDVLPAFEGVEINHGINGLFALTPDGRPIIGEVDPVEGVWVAVGVWVTHAGGVGNILAEWMEHGTPKLDGETIDIHALHIDRFDPAPDGQGIARERYAQQYNAIFGFSHPRIQ